MKRTTPQTGAAHVELAVPSFVHCGLSGKKGGRVNLSAITRVRGNPYFFEAAVVTDDGKTHRIDSLFSRIETFTGKRPSGAVGDILKERQKALHESVIEWLNNNQNAFANKKRNAA